MNKYIESVSHLKKKLEKGVGYEKTLHILHKLQKIPITIDLLHTTGIGKTVRNLSKQNSDTDIGKTAKLLCLTWKAAVKQEQEEQQDYESQHSGNDEHIVKEEQPEEDEEEEEQETYEPTPNSSYHRNEQKVKKEYNNSDEDYDNDLKRSSISYETDYQPISDKRKHSNEDSKSDKRHKKHKSSHKESHKSKETATEPTISSGNFEALLGLSDEIIKTNKKSPNKKREESEKFSKKSYNHSNNTYDKSSVKTETIESNETKLKSYKSSNGLPKELDTKPSKYMDSDILSSLPTAHYKPLPNRDVIEERIEANRKKILKTNEDLSLSIQSKKGRTAVFAGAARTKTYTHVPKLEDLCIQILMDNYDKLVYLYDAPYYLLKPVLQKCNPKQLSRIEKFNPQLMEETDELWQQFCRKEFRTEEPDEEEDETWRELYFRCGRERENRLKNITKNISHKQAKAVPVRQTQFSENVKTPREILRKQERSGISQSFGGPKSGFSGSSSSSSSANHVKIVPEKPKTAPLMKKALKLQRARYRR